MSANSSCVACGNSAGGESSLGQLRRCCACGFVTWEGEPPPGDGLYNERYFTEVDYPDYVGNEPSLRRSMRRHLRQMAGYGRLGGAVLEVGCAYGFFLDEARAHFDRVVGVDVVPAAVERARKRFSVDARAGDLATMDLGQERFDAVCLWDTVEHLPRPDAYLSRIRDLVREDGRLYLTTGDISSLNARLRGRRWRQIHPPSHLHYFSRRTIRRLLERMGFTVLGFETAAYRHTLYTVLASVALRDGIPARISRSVLRLVGERRARRLGFWIDLGDIMFVASRPTGSGEGGA
jgi:SAM-dependent methyltransferase